jgi:ectoine hydroxylase-related dioxygenase (phytanoyl-CoA dioxygenase family)
MCGVWVALEDIDEENGPIIYCPGSHKLPEVTMQDVGKGITHENYIFYEEYIEKKMVSENSLSTETACLKKGQAIIWHGNLLHGGSHHKDKQRTRHSMVTHYYFEGCQYYTPMLSTPDAVHYRTPDWIEMVVADKFISGLEYKFYNLKQKPKTDKQNLTGN